MILFSDIFNKKGIIGLQNYLLFKYANDKVSRYSEKNFK